MGWHPLTYFTALFQKPLYYHAMPGLLDWGVSATVSAALLLAGAALIRRFGSKFYFYL
jgi:ABC-type polysaccharide/polyol phosphate export permease